MGGGLQSEGVVTSADDHLSANTLALQGSQAVQLRSMRAGGRTESSGGVRWPLWLWMGGIGLSRTAATLQAAGLARTESRFGEAVTSFLFWLPFSVWFSLFCFCFCCLTEGKLDVLADQ